MRELYQMPAFQKTVNWDHLRIGVMNHKGEADDGVLTGPYVDYEAAHGRDAL
jgi:glutathionyl-hydroquinone reductase